MTTKTIMNPTAPSAAAQFGPMQSLPHNIRKLSICTLCPIIMTSDKIDNTVVISLHHSRCVPKKETTSVHFTVTKMSLIGVAFLRTSG